MNQTSITEFSALMTNFKTECQVTHKFTLNNSADALINAALR